MKKKHAVIVIIVLVIAVISLGVWLLMQSFSFKGEASAEKRLLAFAHAVNYNKPEEVYKYLTHEQRNQITKEQFVKNFEEERSYPYLTPFFINYLELKISEDGSSGTGIFSVAARLPGEIYEQPFVYENGNYYMYAFQNIVDGSYKKLFDRLD